MFLEIEDELEKAQTKITDSIKTKTKDLNGVSMFVKLLYIVCGIQLIFHFQM